MTLHNAKIATSGFVALMFLFAVVRPSAYGEFSTYRMPFVVGVIVVVLLILALRFLGKLGMALVSAFVWVHFVIFLIELLSRFPWPDGFDETSSIRNITK